MSILWGVLIVVAVTSIAIATMLLVRRRAPIGSYFADGDRASGVFGMLGAGFSILLALIVFLAFESYDTARAGAEAEATIVAQQLQTAQFLPDATRTELSAGLVCYGRSVAGEEWDQLEKGTLGDQVNPWGAALFRTIRNVDPESNAEQSAYDRWMDQTSEREQARNDRVHGLGGVIPTPLWVVLFLLAGVIFVYMLFFADSGERALSQAALMGSVAIAVSSLLLLLTFFDQPFRTGPGGLRPTAMERSLRLIDAELDIAQLNVSPPCDDDGNLV
jgi:hypothetical protein